MDNTLTVNSAANYTYNGTIDQNVALTKSGSGTLTLGGTNSYRGPTTITGGTLVLTGSIGGSSSIDVQTNSIFDVNGVTGAFTVGADQLLKGNGTVNGSVAISGTVSPGASPGTLTFTGSADFDPGSNLALEIASATAFDKLVANGVTLDGPVNLSISLGYTPANNTPFRVVDNTSANPIGGTPGFFTWSGPEGQLTEGEHFFVAGNEFSITYQGGTGNDVVLMYVPEPSTAACLLAASGVFLGLRRRREA